jgi:hypothetical protein
MDNEREHKVCGACKVPKPLSAFHRQGRGHQAWCKSCRKAYDREYHAATRPTRLEQKRAQHARTMEWFRALKADRPCSDCGGVFHPAAMQWDHIPGTEKVADVAQLVTRHNRSAVLAEIAKCELVCANCHALRSFQRRGVAQSG